LAGAWFAREFFTREPHRPSPTTPARTLLLDGRPPVVGLRHQSVVYVQSPDLQAGSSRLPGHGMQQGD
jgi:hypothetical protein